MITENIDDLTTEERIALPAEDHRPGFDALGKPNSWICIVCWGDGFTTAWPCQPAIDGGAELADALGLLVIR